MGIIGSLTSLSSSYSTTTSCIGGHDNGGDILTTYLGLSSSTSIITTSTTFTDNEITLKLSQSYLDSLSVEELVEFDTKLAKYEISIDENQKLTVKVYTKA